MTKLMSKKTLAILLALAVISPLGILVVWNFSEAWGEWGSVGNWVPWKVWSAPLDGYDLSGWDSQLMASLGYIISALVGIAAIILVTYAMSTIFGRRSIQEENK
ncbi:MAG TPA: hypothetical protein VMB46_03245 [Methanomassiliicoccales archaeon]|nr:hypothetical protein [Methanomassiliicoccales archaeon]